MNPKEKRQRNVAYSLSLYKRIYIYIYSRANISAKNSDGFEPNANKSILYRCESKCENQCESKHEYKHALSRA